MNARQTRETLDILSHAPIPAYHDRIRVGAGITQSTRCDIGTVHAIVKTTGAHIPNDTRNEVAAYLLSTVFPGLVNVPPTILRYSESDACDVSIQAWMPETTRLQSWHSILRSDLIGLATFDYIIANSDRHLGNFLQAGRNLYAIDHGGAFSGWGMGSIPYHHVNGQRIPAYIHSHLRDRLLAHREATSRLLSPYLSHDAIERIFDRAVTLTAHHTF